MRKWILEQLTWPEVGEILMAYRSTMTDFGSRGISFSDECLLKEMLRRLRNDGRCNDLVEDRYAVILEAAEEATGWRLTDTSERKNSLIRAFISYRMHDEGYSYRQIGAQMKRDHSTVTHLYNKMVDMISLHCAYKDEVEKYIRFELLVNEHDAKENPS